MGVNTIGARSVYYSKSVWLPAIVIVIFIFSFVHLQTSTFLHRENVSSSPSQPAEVPEDDGFTSELAKDPLRIYVPPAEIPSDNPLDDIFHSGDDKDHPVEITTPEEPEAYHKGPLASEPWEKECPPTPFDISKCPSVQQIAENTNPTPASPASVKSDDRPLVTYAYVESDFGRVNLKFFVAHALHDAADFVFILNGETDVDETLLPVGRPNVRFVKRPNTCFDLGAHAEVLNMKEKGEKKKLKDRYKRFILMNASVRGPFIPHWSRECWTDAYLGRLNKRVKLVGSSLNCMGDGDNAHVQSMIWATDSVGLATILEPEGIGECFDSMAAAMAGEVRTTPHLRSKGYEVDVMLTVYQTEKDYKFVECTYPDDYLFEDGYYGFSVHPFETLFVKSHRGIEDSMLATLTDWIDRSEYSSYDVCKK